MTLPSSPAEPLPLLKDFDGNALDGWLREHGQPAFRRKQIWEWLYRHQVVAFEEMVNLPVSLRQALAAAFLPFSLETIATQTARARNR